MVVDRTVTVNGAPIDITTAMCERDELPWRGIGPGAVQRIRGSEEYRLLLAVLQAWRDPPGTSEGSCLLDKYEGARFDAARQQTGQPVPIDHEIIEKLRLVQFRSSGSTMRQALVARTCSHSRIFTVELAFPNAYNRPSAGVHREVTCGLQGQGSNAGLFWKRFAFMGPLMVDPKEYVDFVVVKDKLNREVRQELRRPGKYHDTKSRWEAEAKEEQTKKIVRATKSAGLERTPPPITMLRKREYRDR